MAQFVDSAAYASVAQWAASTAYTVGQLVRQLATPAVGAERVFVCIVAGTSAASEPTWVTTKGAKSPAAGNDGTVLWMECTGLAGLNGDLSEAGAWPASTSISLGRLCKRNSLASYHICTTAGTTGASEPAFTDTAGNTRTDNTATWTCLGAVGNFTTLMAPHASLAPVLGTTPFASTNEIIYVNKNHAATRASALSLTAIPSGCIVIGIDHTGGVNPPVTLSTAPTETTTGTSALSIGLGTATTMARIIGINFNCSDGSGQADLIVNNAGVLHTENCAFNLKNTNTASRLRLTALSANNYGSYHRNPTFTFGSTSQSLGTPQGLCTVRGGSTAATGSVPSSVLVGGIPAGSGTLVRFIGHDFSGCTAALIGANTSLPIVASLEYCKLAAVALTTLFPNDAVGYGGVLKIHNCDSGGTNINYLHKVVGGAAVSDTAIYRSTGASTGATPFSIAYTSSTLATPHFPYESEEIAIWNNTSGAAKTVTLKFTSDSALTNADLWATAVYAGSSSSALGSVVTSKCAVLATPANLSTNSDTWTGGKTFFYTITLSLTPQLLGPWKLFISVGKASISIWFDPKYAIS